MEVIIIPSILMESEEKHSATWKPMAEDGQLLLGQHRALLRGTLDGP